jgi:hypothetical protein
MFPTQRGLDREDCFLLKPWLTVRVMEPVWLSPQDEDILGLAICFLVFKGRIVVIPHPTPYSVNCPTPTVLLQLGQMELIAFLHSQKPKFIGCSSGYLIFDHASPLG